MSKVLPTLRPRGTVQTSPESAFLGPPLAAPDALVYTLGVGRFQSGGVKLGIL